MNPLEKKIQELEQRIRQLEFERSDLPSRTYIDRDLEVGGKILTDLVKVSTVNITSGAGVPSGAAPQGSMYLRTDGGSTSTLYINFNGSLWTALS